MCRPKRLFDAPSAFITGESDGIRKKGGMPMSQANSDFDQNSPELQKHQSESPSYGRVQKPILKDRDDSSEWNSSPAELYGCLCHQPEYDKRKAIRDRVAGDELGAVTLSSDVRCFYNKE